MEKKIKRFLIVAVDKKNGIGKNGSLPWDIKEDMAHFKEVTSTTHGLNIKNAVIMGRKTWFSIPDKFRPLQNRINVIITKKEIEGQLTFRSIQNAIDHLESLENIGDIFFIGGESIYKEVMEKNMHDGLYITRIHKVFNCDTFFPYLDKHKYQLVSTFKQKASIQIQLVFEFYKNLLNQEEMNYLCLVNQVINNGDKRMDRTGTGILSTFGTSMRFSLLNHKIPLLTTKRIAWKSVVEELLWFISGKTDAKILKDKNVKIWNGNSSREYLDSVGLKHYKEGDIGAGYGFQWRHSGATYSNCDEDYTGKGVDQLINVINDIKNNPTSRRILMCAWNPGDIKKMALPPCHLISQFYVEENTLSCQMYQRSADMGLGVPFNIASYSLLTHMIAHCTGLVAKEFIHIMGDTHVYLDHVEPLKEQLKRRPKDFPKLKISTKNTDITKFKFEDFEIINYNPDKRIKMKMSS